MQVRAGYKFRHQVSRKLVDRYGVIALERWKCEACGILHDRDVNAGINVLKQALHAERKGKTTVGATESHALGEMRPAGGSAQEAQWLQH